MLSLNIRSIFGDLASESVILAQSVNYCVLNQQIGDTESASCPETLTDTEWVLFTKDIPGCYT